MTDRQLDVLETCISALQTGADPDRVLTLFPELSEELRPALEAARFAQTGRDAYVPSAALQRSRTRLLQKAAQLGEPVRRRGAFFTALARVPGIVLAALIVVLVLLVGWQSMVVASAKALPGEPLYSVKRVAEDLNLSILPENETKRAIEVRYEQRRIDEVVRLLEIGRVVDVRFSGVVKAQSQDEWIIDGFSVILPSQEEIHDEIVPGMVVEVSGQTQADGRVKAASIHLEAYEIVGIVEEIDASTWTISGTELQVLRGAQIDPGVRIGNQVIVLVQVSQDAPLRARAILRLLQPVLLPTASSQPMLEETNSISEVEFSGKVEWISQNAWRIAGRDVLISSGTQVKGEISVGDLVKVHALVTEDGTLAAREIEWLTADQDGRDDPDNENEYSDPGLSDPGNGENCEEVDEDQGEPGGGGEESDDDENGDDHSGEEGDSGTVGGEAQGEDDVDQDEDLQDEDGEDPEHEEDNSGSPDSDEDHVNDSEEDEEAGDAGDDREDDDNDSEP